MYTSGKGIKIKQANCLRSGQVNQLTGMNGTLHVYTRILLASYALQCTSFIPFSINC